jgi:hypothetical protein
VLLKTTAEAAEEEAAQVWSVVVFLVVAAMEREIGEIKTGKCASQI